MFSQPEDAKFGWQASNNNNPTEADYIRNGLFCESGLAYPINSNEARCTTFKHMKFYDYDTKQKEIIADPFPCKPNNQGHECELYFNIKPEDAAYSNQF